MPTISVVIPAYNAEKWISATIISVQKQTFSDWEIIIIDDGSTDSTLEILECIVDERLKVFSYKHAGVSVARNHGIAHSTGKFIAFLDADDLWTPDCLELLLAALEQHPEANVSYCWASLIDERGNFLRVWAEVFFEGNIYPQLLVNKNFLLCGSLLIRRQAIESVGEFDPCLTYNEDWDYWLRLARDSSFVLVPKHQLLYRRWVGSSTCRLDKARLDQVEKSRLIALEKAFQSAPIELQCFKKQFVAKSYLYFASQYITGYINGQLEADEVKLTGQKLRKAIWLNPNILLQGWTLKILGKWLLMRTLSPRGLSYCVQIYRRLRRSYKQVGGAKQLANGIGSN